MAKVKQQKAPFVGDSVKQVNNLSAVKNNSVMSICLLLSEAGM